jgi:hypothetical protein
MSNAAHLFDNAELITAASTNIGTLKATRAEVKENQDERHRTLQAEGNIVKVGACGATVFNWSRT